MDKTVLITGATAGIGRACADIFGRHGHHLILTGRRSDRLEELRDELQESYNVRVMAAAFDIRNRKEVEAFTAGLPDEWKVDVLVNNAGLAAGLDPLQEGSIDDWEQMIDTNIKGLLYITRGIVPKMIANGKGHVINIGSIAGNEVYPRGNVYCGTKHAVEQGEGENRLPGVSASQAGRHRRGSLLCDNPAAACQHQRPGDHAYRTGELSHPAQRKTLIKPRKNRI